jgi:hypothetical protein
MRYLNINKLILPFVFAPIIFLGFAHLYGDISVCDIVVCSFGIC